MRLGGGVCLYCDYAVITNSTNATGCGSGTFDKGLFVSLHQTDHHIEIPLDTFFTTQQWFTANTKTQKQKKCCTVMRLRAYLSCSRRFHTKSHGCA